MLIGNGCLQAMSVFVLSRKTRKIALERSMAALSSGKLKAAKPSKCRQRRRLQTNLRKAYEICQPLSTTEQKGHIPLQLHNPGTPPRRMYARHGQNLAKLRGGGYGGVTMNIGLRGMARTGACRSASLRLVSQLTSAALSPSIHVACVAASGASSASSPRPVWSRMQSPRRQGPSWTSTRCTDVLTSSLSSSPFTPCREASGTHHQTITWICCLQLLPPYIQQSTMKNLVLAHDQVPSTAFYGILLNICKETANTVINP